jgi:hypothetical protein
MNNSHLIGELEAAKGLGKGLSGKMGVKYAKFQVRICKGMSRVTEEGTAGEDSAD